MLTPLPTALDRCRARTSRPSGRAVALVVALFVLATQLLLQVHATRHELLPGVHQVCEQCVTAEHSAPPPALAAALPPAVVAAAPRLASLPAPLSRAPLVVRSRAPPSRA